MERKVRGADAFKLGFLAHPTFPVCQGQYITLNFPVAAIKGRAEGVRKALGLIPDLLLTPEMTLGKSLKSASASLYLLGSFVRIKCLYSTLAMKKGCMGCGSVV